MVSNFLSLYRKYRPTSLNGVIGQDLVVKTLSQSVKSNTLSHAYIFTGPAGIGKTSVGYILSKLVNCSSPLSDDEPCYNCPACKSILSKMGDVQEIDGATNRGIDDMKKLQKSLLLTPLYKKKVIIIDEAHMLTDPAWNSLLTTIEEPPSYVIFIFITTEIQKIPNTIQSRCQTFEFNSLDKKVILQHLKEICTKEQVSIENDECLNIIIEEGYFGGLRKILSLLEQSIQASSFNKNVLELSLEQTKKVIYSSQDTLADDLFNLLFNSNEAEIINFFSNLNVDIKENIFDRLISLLRNHILSYTNQENLLVLVKCYNIFVERKQKLTLNVSVKMMLELSCLECMQLLKSLKEETYFNYNLNTISFNKKDLFLKIVQCFNMQFYELLANSNLLLDSTGKKLLIECNNSNNCNLINAFLVTSRANKIKSLCGLDDFVLNDIKIDFK